MLIREGQEVPSASLTQKLFETENWYACEIWVWYLLCMLMQDLLPHWPVSLGCSIIDAVSALVGDGEWGDAVRPLGGEVAAFPFISMAAARDVLSSAVLWGGVNGAACLSLFRE